jgi:Ala-tRNA(Pro) deacylase
MELLWGRPEEAEGRLDKEMRVYDLLDKLNISYHRIDHEEANTMEICQALEATLGAEICKNLLLCNRQCTDFYMLLMPGNKPFKTKDLSKQIGSSRLSFASGEYMEQFLDITPGSLSVLGLMNDKENKVRLLIDEDVLKGEFIGCHPCINTSSLRLRTEDMVNILLPAVGHSYQTVVLPNYMEENDG